MVTLLVYIAAKFRAEYVVDRRRDTQATEGMLPQVSLIWGRRGERTSTYSAMPSSLHFVAKRWFWILGAVMFLEVSWAGD